MPGITRAGRVPRHAAALSFVLLCGGCARYTAAPLANAPDLAASLPHVRVSPASFRLPGVTHTVVDPARGLDVDGAAVLAVLLNPDLRAYRTRAGVAAAQAFSAGLLPDPTFTLTGGMPTSGPPPLSGAIGGALAFSLKSLFIRPYTLRTARAHLHAVDLDVLWQEWQVAQQARLYFVQDWYDQRERTLLERYRALYSAAYRRSETALRQGNTTLDVTGTDLIGLLDAQTRLNTLEQALNKVRHQLAAEIGLAPAAALPLSPSPRAVAVRVPSEAAIRAAMALMPERRPDLLALRAGYRSQDQHLREAIVAQFLPLDISFGGGRDVTNTLSWTGGISIGVPIFNRNRGAIAIARTTRAQLRAEYQARLDTDYGLADELRVQARQLAAQLRGVRARLPTIERTAQAAERAFQGHDLPAASYLLLQTGALNKQIEALSLELKLADTAIALDTIVGLPIREAAARS